MRQTHGTTSAAPPSRHPGRRTWLAAFSVLGIVVAPAAAQMPPPFPGSVAAGEQSTPHVRLGVSASPATVSPGQKTTLTVEVTPKRGMRVYAPGQPEYIPVSLTLDANPIVTLNGAPQLPKPVAHVFVPTGESSLVYDAPFRIEQSLTVAGTPAARRAAKSAGPSVMVTGRLEYQACDDAVCYKPMTVPLTWTVGLAEPAKQTKPVK